jgi:allantoicase
MATSVTDKFLPANLLPAFVIAYSDSSFTNPHEVALPDEPQERTGDFTHMGAKYWGFETARHRATQQIENQQAFRFDHDAYHWIRLGLKQTAQVDRITVSTKWYTGNHVPEIAIELIHNHVTTEVVPRTGLAPDQDHEFQINTTLATECIIRCYHEGGIARINLFGESESTDPAELKPNLLEQALISHISNEHYGSPADAVAGNREVDYMLGWESARAGFGESALFHLARPTMVEEIIVDTYMHRLNPPLSCHIFGLFEPDPDRIEAHMQVRPNWVIEFEDGLRVSPEDFFEYMSSAAYLKEPTSTPGQFTISLDNRAESVWRPLVSFGQLRPDTWHQFHEIEYSEPVTHVLYVHYPNGGIHGLKVYGTET